MHLDLQEKVVLLTGGSRGIGLACARAFLNEGARLALVSRSQKNLEKARGSLRAPSDRVTIIAGDLVEPEAVQTAARLASQTLGPIDVLVNCAGGAKRYLPEELNYSAWHEAMDAKYFTYINAHSCPNVTRIDSIGYRDRPPTQSLERA